MAKIDKEKSKEALSNPSFSNVKNLNYKDCKILCHDLRNKIIDVVSKNGGHLSSNLGMVEITVSLLRNFDALNDDLIFDTGHQSYTYKILTGRDISNIREDCGIAPFLDKDESKFDKVSTGHSGSSLSIAYGMEKAKQLNDVNSFTVAIIGDGALESGLSFEALNNIGADPNSRMIIVFNDNGMSIQQAKGALAKWSSKIRNSLFYGRDAKLFYNLFGKNKITRWIYTCFKKMKDSFKQSLLGSNIFENLGFSYIGPIDGNDVKKVDHAFKRAKLNKRGPIVIHMLTRKGLGYEPALDDSNGLYHGVGPFDYYSGKFLDKSDTITYSKVFASSIDKRLEIDKKAVVIDPAMVVGSNLQNVFNKYQNRCFDVGISEEHAMTFAGGLSLKGAHPIVIEYSTFQQRAYDEILEDIARQKTSVLCIVERAGLNGGDGSSHHGIYDVSMINSIPNCRCYMPYFGKQFRDFVVGYEFNDNGPIFLRIAKEKAFDLDNNSKFYKPLETGLIIEERESDVLILGIGPKGFELINEFDKFDIGMITDLLAEFNIDKLMNYKKIFIYDPYGIEDGTCQIFNSKLFKSGFQGEVISFAFKKEFITFGTNKKLYEDLKLDVESVKRQILSVIDIKSS